MLEIIDNANAKLWTLDNGDKYYNWMKGDLEWTVLYMFHQ